MSNIIGLRHGKKVAFKPYNHYIVMMLSLLRATPSFSYNAVGNRGAV